VFKSIEPQIWRDSADRLTALFLRLIRHDESVRDCCVTFANHLDDENLQSFWRGVMRSVRSSIDEWLDVASHLIEHCPVAWHAFPEYLPEFLARDDDEVNSRFLGVVARRIGVSAEIGVEIAVAIVRAAEFAEARDDMLRSFVLMMNSGVCATQCAILIERLCDAITEGCCGALQALVGQIPGQKGEDQVRAFASILHLLE